MPPGRVLTATPRAQVLDRDHQTVPSDGPKAPAAAPEETDCDETGPGQLSNSPRPSQTESPSDSEPPQGECSEPDSPAEPIGHPPPPIREVNLLVSSAYPAACSFWLLLAYPHSLSNNNKKEL